MSDVADLLAEFMDALGRGEGVPDAMSFVQRAESDADRLELAAQIETALVVASTELRWSGATQSQPESADAALARSIVSAAFDAPRELAVLRERAGLSQDQLAEAVLNESGLEPSAENRAGFRAWIAALESGARSVAELGARAREAIAALVGVGADGIADADEGVLAFRAVEEMGGEGDLVAERLGDVADGLLVGMHHIAEQTPSEAVDVWFKAGRS